MSDDFSTSLKKAAERAFVLAQLPLVKLLKTVTAEHPVGEVDLFDFYGICSSSPNNRINLRVPASSASSNPASCTASPCEFSVGLELVTAGHDLMDSLRAALGNPSLEKIGDLPDALRDILHEVIAELIHSAVYVFGRLKSDSKCATLSELQVEPTHNTTVRVLGGCQQSTPGALTELGIVFQSVALVDGSKPFQPAALAQLDDMPPLV